MQQVKLGVVQPHTRYGARERANLDEAIRYVDQAGVLGVDLLLFPENYPGPFQGRDRYDVVEPMQEAAARAGVSVVAGSSFETEPGSGEFNVVAVVLGKDGDVIGTYRRTHPVGPYIYPGGDLWDLEYREADAFPIFDLGWGKLGVSICSEVFVPEVARILALKGAEICLFPTGLLIDELGYTDNWRTLVRARAIENLMVTATCVNLFSPEFADPYRQARLDQPSTGSGLTAGIAMIATPERVVAESRDEGILCASVDLDRIRWLRETREELIVPAPYATIPGHLAWRRPELYGELVRAPAPAARPN